MNDQRRIQCGYFKSVPLLSFGKSNFEKKLSQRLHSNVVKTGEI